jgi:hypothetical protein
LKTPFKYEKNPKASTEIKKPQSNRIFEFGDDFATKAMIALITL